MFPDIQKAKHLHIEAAKKTPDFIGLDYAYFEKYDGWFMYADCIGGQWQPIKSKEHRTLPSMDNYNKWLKERPTPNADIRIIFEAKIPGMPFSEMNGKFNQRKIALDCGLVQLFCHDVLFKAYPHTTFEKRYDRLTQIVDHVGQPFTLAPILYRGRINDEKIVELETPILARKGEGLIFKALHEPYYGGKRNFSLMKKKDQVAQDLLVIDIERGERGSKYENTLGKLVVRNLKGDVNRVSGMTDAEREAWWANPDLIIGKVVEVHAMAVLANGSLREGRYKWIRHDKGPKDIDRG